MAFTKETPILYYEPKSTERWHHQEYILFPTYCYRVLAPRISTRQLNILEKAVLGICVVGAFTAEEIGEKLDIGKDLSALIISQLQDNKFIDSQGLITEKGQEILNGELVETENLIAGYVFQEPWQGELFPRFIENLEYAETKINESGFPELILGTTGKPYYQKIFMPSPINNTLTVTPNPRDILKAIKIHHKTMDKSNQNDHDNNDESSWNFHKQTPLERISFIEEKPTPVWLTTFIYTSESSFDEFNQDNWQICDPFGLGDSPWLYRVINKSLQKKDNSNLDKSIDKLLNDNNKFNESKERQEKYQDLMFCQEEAISLVENKLSLDIIKWDNLYNALIVIERTYLEIELSATNTKNKYFVNDKCGDIMIKCQKLLENLCLIIAEKYSTEKSWEMLDNKDKEYNKIILENVAEKISLKTKNTESKDNIIKLPRSFLSMDIKQIKLASDHQKGSLRSYLIASLLTAYHIPEHPLYFFMEKIPNLLFQLDELAELRNNSAHRTSQKLNQDTVKQQIDLVYQLLEIFLENFNQTITLKEEIIYG